MRGLDTPRKRRHGALRSLMSEYGHTQADLARAIGKGETYVALRMSGRAPWTLDDCWAVMDYYQLPHGRLAEVFPPRGRA